MSNTPTPTQRVDQFYNGSAIAKLPHECKKFMLELAAELEQVKKDFAEAERELGRHQPGLCDEIRMDRDDLRRQIESAMKIQDAMVATIDSLKADMELVDWLERHAISIEVDSPRQFLRFGDLREAVRKVRQSSPAPTAPSSPGC